MQCFNSFSELLQERAARLPHQKLYTFLKDGEEAVDRLTYCELDECAKKIGYHLQNQLTAGQRAILLFPAGLDFIRSFFACLYAGIIAIPLPIPNSKAAGLHSIQAIIEQAGVAAIITSCSAIKSIDFGLFNHLEIIDIDHINLQTSPKLTPLRRKVDDLAFLQYTSGSTSAPKGVMVSHGNLLHNQRLVQASFGTTAPEGVFVSWLPHYHDMGLIGNILHPIYSEYQSILMAPMAFLQKPLRWLKAISDYRGFISGAPNFAYELCTTRISDSQKQGLDLSSWKLAFNGAEKVRAETMARFIAAFELYGFSLKSFMPTYGLAEGTLFATGGTFQTGARILSVAKEALEQGRLIPADLGPTQQLVSVGHAWLDQQAYIVHPETQIRCPEKQVGEIWLKGPSVAQGYWNAPTQTQTQFHAYLANGDGPFFRTGDLGAMYAGELYITGRMKDLIILRGRNLYPDDLESAAESAHEALKVTSSAAFSVEMGDEEALILVQEIERSALRNLDLETLFTAICQALFKQFTLLPHTIVLLMPHRLPKTTSGKVQRQKTKALFLKGELIEIARKSL